MVRESSRLIFAPTWTLDLHEGINVQRMREQRAARARQILKKHSIPAMLVTGGANVRYLVGFWWLDFRPAASYCLFFAEHDPVVFAHAGSFQQSPDQAPWIKNWRIARSSLGWLAGPQASLEEMRLFASEIKGLLQEKGLAGEPLAVVDFDILDWEAMKEKGLRIVDGIPLLLEASQIKTVDEVNCLKMAASLGGVGFQAALENLKPGITQNQISRIIL
ncbi:aminopeptidase P family N-terminal domain-containing protein, partial [Candidatus Bathyarchaeota archaeon]|nr:aminopeptidase P family N-terminal domain-containing protein [Candidatus Bathyarchaeota archaeon]